MVVAVVVLVMAVLVVVVVVLNMAKYIGNVLRDDNVLTESQRFMRWPGAGRQ